MPAFAIALLVALCASPVAGADGADLPPVVPTSVDPATSTSAPDPGAIAPADPAPVLDAAALQTLAALHREVSVATTQAAADTAAAIARTTLSAARARLDQATAAVVPAEAAAQSAGDAQRLAREELTGVEEQLAAVASETFQVSSTSSDVMSGDPLSLLDGGDRFADRSNGAAFGEVAIRSLRRQLDQVHAAVGSADTNRDEAVASLTAARSELVAASTAVSVAEADLARVVTDGANAVEQARSSGEVEPVGPDGPSIMGESVVSAADMAAFVQARGHPDPGVDLMEVARAFLAEGELEGVRGDIAFVQSIIETGWFSFRSSMLAPEDHNYAGIGACDSCSDGFGYPSVELGVRAQIQLLAAYAQPGITSADYARPPVRTLPERLGVRGCCGTWMALSGVWATGAGYGQKILKLYDELLAFAVSRAAAG